MAVTLQLCRGRALDRLLRFDEAETAWLAEYRRMWEVRLDRFGAALESRRMGRTRKGEEKHK